MKRFVLFNPGFHSILQLYYVCVADVNSPKFRAKNIYIPSFKTEQYLIN